MKKTEDVDAMNDATGSCEECGCDIGPDEYSGLCELCGWWLEHTANE